MKRVLEEHYRYLADPKRIDAYRQALQRTVRPGDVVVDLGCGTGILGLLACEAGAGRVLAIDRGGILEIARQAAVDAGFSERIMFIRGDSTRVDANLRADVLVCDQLGPLGFDANILSACDDARQRLLSPGATLVPSDFTTQLTPVEVPLTYEHVHKWSERLGGYSFTGMRQKAANTLHPIVDDRPRALAPLSDLWHFNLSDRFDATRVWRAKLSWTVDADGLLHGLQGSFVATLCPGVTLTNHGPIAERLRRSSLLLPVMAAVPVQRGDRIEAEVVARPEVILAWTVTVTRGTDRLAASSHSTLAGEFLSIEDIRLPPTPGHLD